MFAFQDRRGAVDVAFTDRHGGVSGGPYTSLNLAESGGDELSAVEENTAIVSRAFAAGAAHLVRMRQVHGADVTGVDQATTKTPECDGLVTDTPGVLLLVRVADCVPVLLADVGRGVVGAAHAGRPGLVAGVVPATIEAMRGLGAQQITAWVGPHVCGNCYEVPATMREEVSRVVPEAYAETSWGTPSVDIGAGVRAQLESCGAEVTGAEGCTIESEHLYSYRRQGTSSGRQAGLVWIRP